MVHPCQRDVRDERLLGGVEPERGGRPSESLVQCGEFGLPRPDAEPDDGDVLETRKHPVLLEAELERSDVTSGDGRVDCFAQLGQTLVVGVAEKLQRHVCLFGVGESEPVDVCERCLDPLDGVGEFRKLDGDEQPHT